MSFDGMKIITNPAVALLEVGKENSELHEEQARTWTELDLYRTALTTISTMPYEPARRVALAALAQQRVTS